MIVNGGFESGNLLPWFEGRSFGSSRSWAVGSLDPHSGQYYAFNLGPLELRQDFAPISGCAIRKFSVFVSHKLPNIGSPGFEIFYSDGSSSGLQEHMLNPSNATGGSSSGWVWEEVDLLPYVDITLNVSGVSVVGIPDNVLSIDSFTLETIPEPSGLFLIAASILVLLLHRRKFIHSRHRRSRCG
jgi:hypothetical protein